MIQVPIKKQTYSESSHLDRNSYESATRRSTESVNVCGVPSLLADFWAFLESSLSLASVELQEGHDVLIGPLRSKNLSIACWIVSSLSLSTTMGWLIEFPGQFDRVSTGFGSSSEFKETSRSVHCGLNEY